MEAPLAHEPAENLTNRTFVGLIIAQFLAGFNDQAIHAAAMFYAIHTRILAEADAITLMPILFYSPWAIFCTLAGYYADRYSKTMTLRVWKMSEIVISLIMIAGFILGSRPETVKLGGWLVMSCVFMMGTHAAFFAPAKYGAMPEILRPHILSRGNGILESTTFLASILGTVSGGLLFTMFRDNEVWIGVILLILSLIGAAASFMIAWLPPACPERVFPTNLVKPLIDNLKVMFRSRPLALAVLGIAFFVFMVSYMRASMYMHGETRNPRWDEQKTSLVVATVALGVGLGSPLAGYLSGGKVELGLVPLGCIGMIIALLTSAFTIEHTNILVLALITIGFFSGFYMVPLYTLLQHRAPKASKGELVATSNFINVTGAIVATLLFKGLVTVGRVSSITPAIPVEDVKVQDTVIGVLVTDPTLDKRGKIKDIVIRYPTKIEHYKAKSEKRPNDVDDLIGLLGALEGLEPLDMEVIDFEDNFYDVLSGMPKAGDEVIVSTYKLRGVQHYRIRKKEQAKGEVYDNEKLPQYLFFGAALMTLAILFVLRRKLPDFYVRSLFWFKSLGKFRLKAVGMQHLPTEGPVILTTNCKDLMSCLQLVSATDRSTKVILIESAGAMQDGALLRGMALRYNLVTIRPEQDEQQSWAEARREAIDTLQNGHLLAISIVDEQHAERIDTFLQELRKTVHAPILPVFCGSLDENGPSGVTPRIRVVFGELMQEAEGGVHPLGDCKKAIHDLGEWIRQNDESAGTEHH